MKPVFKHTALACVLALSALTAMAQPTSAPTSLQPGMGCNNAGGCAMRGERMAQLKARLAIAPEQEGAWTAFASKMQTPAMGQADFDARQKQRAEIASLPLPERMERMQALRAEREKIRAAHMAERADALKTLHAALTPEQQKVLDVEHTRMMRRSSMSGRMGRGGIPGQGPAMMGMGGMRGGAGMRGMP